MLPFVERRNLAGNLKRASPRIAHQIEEWCARKRRGASFFSPPKLQKMRRPEQCFSQNSRSQRFKTQKTNRQMHSPVRRRNDDIDKTRPLRLNGRRFASSSALSFEACRFRSPAQPRSVRQTRFITHPIPISWRDTANGPRSSAPKVRSMSNAARSLASFRKRSASRRASVVVIQRAIRGSGA